LGNDEFIVAQLTEEISSKLIHGIRRRLNVLIDKYNTSAGKPYKINIASGSSTARVNNMNEMEHLVNAAVSRKNGNKTKEMRMHNMSKLTDEEMKQTDIVKRLLDENRFSYHFQPIVDAHTGDIFAYEALMRADVTPYISPLLILKYAEHLGRMDEIEKATFMNVLKFVEEHEDEFDGKKIFINSIPGLKLPHDDVKAICDRLKNFSGQVVVEMTEQSEAEDAELDHKKHVYQELGVQVAVDDYGTGYSNIVNLLRYMPDYVKIDRMLLSGIQNNPQKQHFVKEIVEFAHDNDFLVLAEGVETVEELQTVITLGSDLIQGYYTERPNPVVMQEIDKKIKEEIIEAYNHK
jgi:EAL domain-containing protein (putative c-di-GMP-specific phosphodiesterase class I)